MKRFLLGILVLCLFTGCAGANPCDAGHLEESYAPLETSVNRFYDLHLLAFVTPQRGLSPILMEMHAARREILDLVLPECLQPARDTFVDYAELTIDGVMAIQSGDEEQATARFDEAQETFSSAAELIDLLMIDAGLQSVSAEGH